MQAVLADAPLRNLLQRNVDVFAVRVPKDRPAVLDWPSGDVVQRLPPEREHRGEVVAVDDDRADSHSGRFSSRRPRISHGAIVKFLRLNGLT